jgi:hypothetical protein
MKRFQPFLLFGMLAIGGLLFSLFVTMVAWNIQIEHHALQCIDIGFGSFFVNMDTHQAAGDSVSPGWTWEKLRVARTAYEVAFFSIWFASAGVPIMLISSRSRRRNLAEAT